MPGSILGNRVVRTEDPTSLTTGGQYLDDLTDVSELAGAAAMPGVLGIFTAADHTGVPATAERVWLAIRAAS